MSAFRSNRGVQKPYARPAPRGNADGQWLHDRAPTAPKADLNGNGRTRITPISAVAASNNQLVVSNLHYEITAKDLTAIFGQIGTLVREPLIRYDRSGRSSGLAIIAFETSAEATRAKKQFDGILAKGLPMSIAYDTQPPRNPRRAVSAPTSSLLHRIQKPPLADRLSRDDTYTKAPSGPRATIGPVRSRPPRNLPSGPNAGKGSRSMPKKPKTAEELDKELDAFMGDSEPAPQQEQVQDVEMA